MWENKPLHREMLLWSQCNQQTTSPAQKTKKIKSGPRKSQSKRLKWNCSCCSSKIKLKVPRLHSGAAIDRPETTKLPPIPEVVWQQPQETHWNNMHKNKTTNDKRRNDVESQTSPIWKTSPQVSGSETDLLLGNQTSGTAVQCPNDSKKQQTETQRNETDMTANESGDDNISPPKIITSQVDERLVRDDITNELYMPVSSTILLKRKKEMLYVHLEFENGLTIAALVDSGSVLVQKLGKHNQTTSPSQYLQNRRRSQFLNPSSKWPVRKTNSNSHN